jgi:acyl-CoA synthetase (AMP-forming)/AMP-acid ligase II
VNRENMPGVTGFVVDRAAATTWARLFADRLDASPAVVAAGRVWSGVDFAARAAGAADWLDTIGAHPGQPVAALVSSTPEAYALTVGAASTQRPLAPLGPRLTPAELRACLAPLHASVLVAEPSARDTAVAAAAGLGLRVEVHPEFAASARPLDLDAAPTDIAAILHTSGTSGQPKPVPYTQERLARRTNLNAALLGLGPGSIYASVSPFHHIAGLGMLFVAMGAGAALCPFPQFSVDAWEDVVEQGVTHALLVPTVVESLLDAGRLRVGRLRCLHYGASPIEPDTLQRLMAALPGVAIAQIYGQTEGSPITCLTTEDHQRIVDGELGLLGSSGRAVTGVDLVIDHPDAAGIGEVWARADHFFRTDADGWMRTGDLGRVDADGYLFLTGRKGDLIIRGGENVYPEEVERVLRTHPAVRDAAVIGEHDHRLGQRVVAHVVLMTDVDPPSAAELRAHAREVLAGFKVPERWVYADELPRNAAGKVLRRLLVTDTKPATTDREPVK